MLLCGSFLAISVASFQDRSMTHSPFLNSLRDSRILWLSGLSWLVSLGIASNAVQAQAPTTAEPESSSTTPVTTLPKILPTLPPSYPSDSTPPIAPTVVAPDSDPLAAPAPSVGAPTVGGTGAFIDRTDYNLGATQRIEPAATLAKPTTPSVSPRVASVPASVTPVQVGGLSWRGNTLSWNAGQTSAIGQAYNTVQNYYNRTVRPFGRIGNGDLRLIFPLAIPAPITSLFGWRIHPISGDARLHAGTDIGAPMGTPVLAALTGRVIMADFFGGYGLAVALEHQTGSQQTLYAHLSEVFVKPGEIIKQGSVLGRVGSTGASTGPHLHFEFRQQTAEGWVAMDAGLALETAVAEFAKSLQMAQNPAVSTTPKTPEWSRSSKN